MVTRTRSVADFPWPAERVIDRLKDLIPAVWEGLPVTGALFLSGAYLIDIGWRYAGLAVLAWSGVRLVGHAFRRVALGVDSLSILTCTCTTLRTYLRIDRILSHPSMQQTFERLRERGKFKGAITWEDWRDSLIARYRPHEGDTERAQTAPLAPEAADEEDLATEDQPAKDKEAPWPPVESVTFEIRAGQLWKNGQYQSWPAIVHEVLIPDESLRASRETFFPTREYDGVRIRVVVLNGVLKLQIGEWTTETTHSGDQSGWVAWDTLTSFPLILKPWDHWIPPHFLLLEHYMPPYGIMRMATRSYFASQKAFGRVCSDYARALFCWGGVFDWWGRDKRVAERLATRFQAWVEREGFKKLDRDGPGSTWANALMSLDLRPVRVDDRRYYESLDSVHGGFSSF